MPAAVATKLPSDTSHVSLEHRPQHSMVPSVVTAQVFSQPADTEA